MTKSKTLTLLISLAIILFISALLWKQFSVDNSEPITIKKVTPIKPKKTKPKPTASETNLVADPAEPTLENDGTNYQETAPNIKAKRAKLERKLNMSLMFKNPEDVMDTVKVLQKQGKDDLANEYLDYLIETYPDFDIE